MGSSLDLYISNEVLNGLDLIAYDMGLSEGETSSFSENEGAGLGINYLRNLAKIAGKLEDLYYEHIPEKGELFGQLGALVSESLVEIRDKNGRLNKVRNKVYRRYFALVNEVEEYVWFDREEFFDHELGEMRVSNRRFRIEEAEHLLLKSKFSGLLGEYKELLVEYQEDLDEVLREIRGFKANKFRFETFVRSTLIEYLEGDDLDLVNSLFDIGVVSFEQMYQDSCKRSFEAVGWVLSNLDYGFYGEELRAISREE